MASSGKILQPQSLPAYADFYNKFWGASNECDESDGWTQQWRNKLNNELNRYTGLLNFREKIMHAYCYACKKKGDYAIDTEKIQYIDAPCHFFYYWLEKQVPIGQNNYTLSEVLGTIYSTLKDVTNGHKCTVKYEDVDKFLFNLRKDVYEYYHGSDYIYRQTRNAGDTCNEDYRGYLERIKSVYTVVNAHCTDKPDDDYCSTFWKENKTKIHGKLLKLECAPPPREKEVATCSLEPHESVSSTITEQDLNKATTTTALSSIFGTLGMTVAPFLLYKYSPLPSWISSTLGLSNSNNGTNRRNRKKRYTEQQQFDTLTEVSSTIGSTTEDESTLASTDYSTTLRSAEYTGHSTRQPKGRAGTGTNANTNNNRPGHHQRTNVGYGMM